jgi:small subunit ribosomal protein S20
MAKEEKKEEKKVKRPTAQKRAHQSEKSRLRNKAFKTEVRSAIRKFETSLKGDPASIKEQLSNVYSLMDKGVKKGIYKINKASRTKARLTAHAAAAKA